MPIFKWQPNPQSYRLQHETFLANRPIGQLAIIIAQSKKINFVYVGMPDFREGRKVGSKLEKLSFFQENQEQLFQFFTGRIEALLLHILDLDYPSFYLKCPSKHKKTYNFDNFDTSQICISSPRKL